MKSSISFGLIAFYLLASPGIAQTTTTKIREIKFTNPSAKPLWFIVRSANDRKQKPTKYKVAAESKKTFPCNLDAIDVWYALGERSTAIQFGSNILFDENNLIEVSPAFAVSVNNGVKTVHVLMSHRTSANITKSKWRTKFATEEGNLVDSVVSLSGDKGTFTTPSGNGSFTEVKYLDIEHDLTEVSGNWSVAGFDGRFIFNIRGGKFWGSANKNIKKDRWDRWDGTIVSN